MPTIPGASSYLGAARLANTQGIAAATGNFFTGSGIATDILDISRNFAVDSVGLSQRARLLNRQLLENNASDFNALFSLTGGTSATIESALTQILGIRAKIPASRLAASAVEVESKDDGSLSAPDIGLNVNKTA